jgi:hypothetical protein
LEDRGLGHGAAPPRPGPGNLRGKSRWWSEPRRGIGGSRRGARKAMVRGQGGLLPVGKGGPATERENAREGGSRPGSTKGRPLRWKGPGSGRKGRRPPEEKGGDAATAEGSLLHPGGAPGRRKWERYEQSMVKRKALSEPRAKAK